MIKSNEGITLISLSIVVLLMFILASVGINLGYTSINNVKDNKLNADLGIVKQAIFERYHQAFTLNKTNIKNTEERLSFWVGVQITDFSTVELPAKDSITLNDDINKFYDNLNNYNCEYQEDYYYRLTPKELEDIGVSNSEDTYIVNYKTCEVYNETQKIDSNSGLLYLPSSVYNTSTNNGDNDSFNDW